MMIPPTWTALKPGFPLGAGAERFFVGAGADFLRCFWPARNWIVGLRVLVDNWAMARENIGNFGIDALDRCQK